MVEGTEPQLQLLEAIFSKGDVRGLEPRGLKIYRRNLIAQATRTLVITYPTVACLVGANQMHSLARGYLREYRKSVFNWSHWGESFPSWLATQDAAIGHQYLPDCALLDWLVHTASSAPDRDFDLTSISAAVSLDHLNLSLRFAPGCAVLDSPFPVVSIYQAHRENSLYPDLREANALLQRGEGQTALIWRRGPHVHLRTVPGAEKQWLQLLEKEGMTLGEVIQTISTTTMPLNTWLEIAIREQLIVGLQIHS